MTTLADKRLIDRDLRKGRAPAQNVDESELVDLSDRLRRPDAEELEQVGAELVQKGELRRARIERQLAEEPQPKVAPRGPIAPLSPSDI